MNGLFAGIGGSKQKMAGILFACQDLLTKTITNTRHSEYEWKEKAI